jgi:hypothetical protein
MYKARENICKQHIKQKINITALKDQMMQLKHVQMLKSDFTRGHTDET